MLSTSIEILVGMFALTGPFDFSRLELALGWLAPIRFAPVRPLYCEGCDVVVLTMLGLIVEALVLVAAIFELVGCCEGPAETLLESLPLLDLLTRF